jgi:UDP-N-acetylmuramate dehydrogenase
MLDYGNIREELMEMQVTAPTITDVRDAVCNIRRRKLPDPAEIGNAGSFFKNPVVSEEILVSLQKDFPGIPFYPVLVDYYQKQAAHDISGDSIITNQVKIPAAWLIEQCGWKGFRSGDAGVHPNQPLVLVNYGTATGTQILGLAHQILDSVEKKFGIRLEMEVNVIG